MYDSTGDALIITIGNILRYKICVSSIGYSAKEIALHLVWGGTFMVVHCVKLLTEYTIATSAPQFVGRQREIKSLWNQYKAARGGSARVALLVGELGVGKTRLLDEFALRAKKDGAIVLRGGTSESEGMPPYLPFLEALGQHIRETPLSIF